MYQFYMAFHTFNIVMSFAGVVHAGIGERKANNLITAMNVPPPTKPTVKSREREVGAAIEAVADLSVVQALEKEKEATRILYDVLLSFIKITL